MATKISLVPTSLDLALYAGDGAELVVTMTNSHGQTLLVNGEVLAQIRAKRDDPDPAAVFAADLSNGDDGKVVISLTGDETAALINGGGQFNGVWDLQWTPDGLEPVTVLQGKVTCDPDVTR